MYLQSQPSERLSKLIFFHNFCNFWKVSIIVDFHKILTISGWELPNLVRWCITLFSQSALISQLHLHEEIDITFPNVFYIVCIWKNCFQASFYIICASGAGPSFFAIISAFALWHFVLVKNYQVMFHLTKANHLKSILWTSQKKTALHIVRYVLQRFNFISRNVISYRFIDMARTVRNFLKRPKLISLPF